MYSDTPPLAPLTSRQLSLRLARSYFFSVIVFKILKTLYRERRRLSRTKIKFFCNKSQNVQFLMLRGTKSDYFLKISKRNLKKGLFIDAIITIEKDKHSQCLNKGRKI